MKDRNAEGYPDPTFGGAWGNMRRRSATGGDHYVPEDD